MPKQTEPIQDPTLHTTDGTGVTANIIGFSVDPSKYPAANVWENTIIIYQYLTSTMGLNHAGACGVLANIQLESNFNSLALGDGGSSYGICQWHNGRFNNLISFCNGMGADYNTVNGQLQFLSYELEKNYPAVLHYIKNVPDTAQGHMMLLIIGVCILKFQIIRLKERYSEEIWQKMNILEKLLNHR